MAREPSEKAKGLYEELLPKLAGEAEPSAREAAALDFAEKLALSHTELDEAYMAGLRRHFSDAECVELGLAAAAFLMLGRLHHAFGVAPMTASAHEMLHPEGGPE